jgi:hypothetical protein
VNKPSNNIIVVALSAVDDATDIAYSIVLNGDVYSPSPYSSFPVILTYN